VPGSTVSHRALIRQPYRPTVLIAIPSQIGYGALFGFVFAESAGVPLPGETALIAAGLLAGTGQLALPAVIAVAAGAAILGDNLGYWLGRRGGRGLLLRDGRLAVHRRKAVAKGDEFFERHGGKAVFLGRWVSGVRIVAAVLAGAGAMRWRTFLLYNALGALAWSATVAGIPALTGPVGAAIVYGAGIAAAGGGAVFAGVRAWLRRRHRTAAEAPA
jgi:membrane protein DedA with SNARE-associated domain